MAEPQHSSGYDAAFSQYAEDRGAEEERSHSRADRARPEDRNFGMDADYSQYVEDRGAEEERSHARADHARPEDRASGTDTDYSQYAEDRGAEEGRSHGRAARPEDRASGMDADYSRYAANRGAEEERSHSREALGDRGPEDRTSEADPDYSQYAEDHGYPAEDRGHGREDFDTESQNPGYAGDRRSNEFQEVQGEEKAETRTGEEEEYLSSNGQPGTDPKPAAEDAPSQSGPRSRTPPPRNR